MPRRPANGERPMTPAEKKAAQRARDSARTADALRTLLSAAEAVDTKRNRHPGTVPLRDVDAFRDAVHAYLVATRAIYAGEN